MGLLVIGPFSIKNGHLLNLISYWKLPASQKVCLFSYFKHCFWPSLRWQGWPAYSAFLAIQFLPSWPLLNPLRAKTKKATLDNRIPGQLASPYYILPFILGSHQQQVEGNSPGSLQGPPNWRGGQGQGGPSQWRGRWQPASSELWGGLVWVVMGPQGLWQVIPHYRMVTSLDTFGNMFLSI